MNAPNVYTRFWITSTAYAGQYFIVIDEYYPEAEQYENCKKCIMAAREIPIVTGKHLPVLDKNTGRFSIDEIKTFLEFFESV